MPVKTLLEIREGALAARAAANLAFMKVVIASLFIASLFREAQERSEVDPSRDSARLARRYQSDLAGLRAMLERPGIDGAALAGGIAGDLDRLAEPA